MCMCECNVSRKASFSKFTCFSRLVKNKRHFHKRQRRELARGQNQITPPSELATEATGHCSCGACGMPPRSLCYHHRDTTLSANVDVKSPQFMDRAFLKFRAMIAETKVTPFSHSSIWYNCPKGKLHFWVTFLWHLFSHY